MTSNGLEYVLWGGGALLKKQTILFSVRVGLLIF